MLTALLATASCDDINNQVPQTGIITAEQSVEAVEEISSRTEASFNALFPLLGKPMGALPSNSRPDDFGFSMAALSLDMEGADLTAQANDYNWFSAASEYSSRNPDYANPLIRYKSAYMVIGAANDVLAAIPEETTDATLISQKAQARAIRAYSYMALAPYYQGRYVDCKDQPCVPILESGVDITNNPRATVEKVYEYIMEDLNYAVENLAGFQRSGKAFIDQQVAYGLRARAYLNMGMYKEAAADAEKALQGYTPASIEEVSVPAFCNMANEHNWIWGINMTSDMVEGSKGNATIPSWLCAFTGNGYGTATGNVPVINSMLYNKISTTDVRHGWWLDENMHSPNWADIEWKDGSTVLAKGDDIAETVIPDVKLAFLPYTNIKFGMKSGVGSSVNDSDWPLMRVEEMILVQVEGLAKSGEEAKAKQILTDFVKTYRDPQYTIPATNVRSFEDEIWFQRRVELWGEGFFVSDARRLNKPIVRFHGEGTSNFPEAYQFNISPDDPWLNMRFSKRETNNNAGIVNNTGGSLPAQYQNPGLRDGVTD